MAKPKQFTKPAKGIVSASKLARELGISVSSVSQKRQRGKTDNQIREEAKQWAARQVKLSRKKQTATTPAEGETRETFADAQLRKERALADKHELDILARRGELVEVAAVNAFVSQSIVAARDILAKIAPELSDRLAAETSPVRVREMIEAEVSRALTRLSLFKPIS